MTFGGLNFLVQNNWPPKLGNLKGKVYAKDPQMISKLKENIRSEIGPNLRGNVVQNFTKRIVSWQRSQDGYLGDCISYLIAMFEHYFEIKISLIEKLKLQLPLGHIRSLFIEFVSINYTPSLYHEYLHLKS